ncbi:MAG: aspartyl-trna synthetase [Alphaproteobacteria bacterium]|nr:aspartyl-trna synthetase [Alphaproteobacteria bacterium]
MRHVIHSLVLIAFAAASGAAWADAAVGTASGLPVPRFVSLKTDKVAVRGGPNKTHDIKWLFQRSGLPVEITAEFETWRRIRDADGAEGWVYHSLLSGRRTGIVTAKSKDELVSLHDRPDVESAVVAKLEPGVIGRVARCADGWCRVSGRGFEGWVRQVRLWGVYPNEKVE